VHFKVGNLICSTIYEAEKPLVWIKIRIVDTMDLKKMIFNVYTLNGRENQIMIIIYFWHIMYMFYQSQTATNWLLPGGDHFLLV
jgi:hypothetical protein